MTRDATRGLLAHGLVLPTSATIHQRKPKYRCSLCDFVLYEGEDERVRVNHALSHRDDPRIREPDPHEPTFGEADPEKLGWMKRRFAQTGSLDPRDY